MMENNRVAAYGEAKRFINYVFPGDIVFFSHKGVGLVAAAKVKGEKINADDISDMDWFSKQYSISKYAHKELVFRHGHKGRLVENIRSTKLLVLIYEMDGKKIFAVGPIFDYKEK